MTVADTEATPSPTKPNKTARIELPFKCGLQRFHNVDTGERSLFHMDGDSAAQAGRDAWTQTPRLDNGSDYLARSEHVCSTRAAVRVRRAASFRSGLTAGWPLVVRIGHGQS